MSNAESTGAPIKLEPIAEPSPAGGATPEKNKSQPARFDLKASAAKLRRALRGGLLFLYTLLALVVGLAYPALTRAEELLRAHWQTPWHPFRACTPQQVCCRKRRASACAWPRWI